MSGLQLFLLAGLVIGLILAVVQSLRFKRALDRAAATLDETEPPEGSQ